MREKIYFNIYAFFIDKLLVRYFAMYMKINVTGDYSSILQLEIDLMVGKNLFHWEVFFVIPLALYIRLKIEYTYTLNVKG